MGFKPIFYGSDTWPIVTYLCVVYLLQVHLRSHFIMNGVCVRWRGWIDLERLDGVGCLEYDEDKAQVPNIYYSSRTYLWLEDLTKHSSRYYLYLCIFVFTKTLLKCLQNSGLKIITSNWRKGITSISHSWRNRYRIFPFVLLFAY